jgi:SNW domain-containing protein 1
MLWDFADGGAFPEFAVPQFPGGRGRSLPALIPAREAPVAAAAPAVSRSALMVVQQPASALSQRNFTADELAPLDAEALSQLDELTAARLDAARHKTAAAAAPSTAPGETHVVQMGAHTIAVTEARVDALDTTRHKLVRLQHAAGGGDLGPIVRSPTKKPLGGKESFAMADVVSGWKNPKSKLISLADREAQDGANHVHVKASSGHAAMAAALRRAEVAQAEQEAARQRDVTARADQDKERLQRAADAALEQRARDQAAAAAERAGAGVAAERRRQREEEEENIRRVRRTQRLAEQLGVDAAALMAMQEDVEGTIEQRREDVYDSRLARGTGAPDLYDRPMFARTNADILSDYSAERVAQERRNLERNDEFGIGDMMR